MLVLKDESGKEYKFETYNNLLVQEGAVTAINNRVTTERTAHETKYTELEGKFKELGTQHEELKVKGMTEAQRRQHEDEQRAKKELDLADERDKHRDLFKKHKTDTDFSKAFSEYKEAAGVEPYDYEQAQKLIMMEYDASDLVNDTDIVFKKGSATITVKDAVKTFLENEKHANLLKSGLIPGGNTRTNLDKGNLSGKTIKRAEWEKLPPEAQMQSVTDKVQIVD